MAHRRQVLAGGAALGALGLFMPRIATAAVAGDRKLLFVLLRGAADGLAVLAPVGDPAFERQRGQLAADYQSAPKIGSFFALHPALAQVGAMFSGGEALIAHAVATGYRERSHFDAQNLLETGGERAHALQDGWLNRLIGLMPEPRPSGMAVAPAIPLALRGPQTVSSYAPSALPAASEGLMARLDDLYAHDEQLHAMWTQALATRAMAGDAAGNLRNAQEAGQLAARLMQGAGGAGVAMIDLDGWDSHANQRGLLGRQLRQLDTLLAAYRAGMGEAWADTLVIAATEFGRTVKLNGTGGTDHGTAGMALLLGGAVRGGRVIADWPGLADAALHEGRDLRPTASLEALLAGACAAHFGIDPTRAMPVLFPGRTERPVEGLLKA